MAETFPFPELVTKNSQKLLQNRIQKVQFRDGILDIHNQGINANTESWSLEVAPLDLTQQITIRNFLQTVSASGWFYWTPLDEATPKKWFIKEKSVRMSFINPSAPTYRYTFEVIQAFSNKS